MWTYLYVTWAVYINVIIIFIIIVVIIIIVIFIIIIIIMDSKLLQILFWTSFYH